MMMDDHVVEYVSGLPAVKSVTNDRIRYTDEFKRRVAEGYRRGESPVAMFRKAGLGPVGHRIQEDRTVRRALARPRPGRGREVRRAGVPGRAAPWRLLQ